MLRLLASAGASELDQDFDRFPVVHRSVAVVRVPGIAAHNGRDERPLDGFRQHDVHLGHEGRQDVGG